MPKKAKVRMAPSNEAVSRAAQGALNQRRTVKKAKLAGLTDKQAVDISRGVREIRKNQKLFGGS